MLKRKRKGLSGGKKFGPPPKGPNPQGITVSNKEKKSQSRLTSLVLLMAKVIFHTRKQKKIIVFPLCLRNDR